MQKKISSPPALVAAFFLVSLLLPGLPAMAESWSHGWDEAEADAGFGGFGGADMSSDWSSVDAYGVGGAFTSAETDPVRAEGSAWLFQENGGFGSSEEELEGDLLQTGWTFAGADAGGAGREAETYTLGEGRLYGFSDGEDSIVMGGMTAGSEQSSDVVDYRNGGHSDAEASQTTSVWVMGEAFDESRASVSVFGTASSEVVAGSNGDVVTED